MWVFGVCCCLFIPRLVCEETTFEDTRENVQDDGLATDMATVCRQSMFVKLYPLIYIQKPEQTHKSYPMWHLVSGDNRCENSENCESGIFLALKKFTADHA
jgi:hypothetical protein